MVTPVGSVWWDMKFGTHQTAPGIELRYASSIIADGIPLVLLNGRGEFIEKYAGVIQTLNEKGYSVWTLEWRGQGLSSRVHADRLRGHIRSFEEYLHDVRHWLDGVVFPVLDQPPMLLAHSMGGHLALRLLATHSGRFTRTVVIAPLIGFRPRFVLPLFTILIRLVCLLGLGHWYFFGANYDPANPNFQGNTLTNCPEQFAIKPQWIRNKPELAIAGVTYQWLDSAIRSIRHLKQEASKITNPVLLVSPEDEQVVDRDAALRFAESLQNCEVYSIADAKHEVLFEVASVRHQLWARIQQFFNGHER